MDQMTSDMSGAAAVVATVDRRGQAAAAGRGDRHAALAENLPSGIGLPAGRRAAALRRRRRQGQEHGTGKTVHVLNTDAEGRLVLADAIVRACEDDPDYLLETSTLTGAQVVALGKRTMGVMGTPELRDRVAELAREVGEGGWAMPLPEHLREGLDSPLADLQNIAGDPGGGMLVAGHYLAEFVAGRGQLGAPGRRRARRSTTESLTATPLPAAPGCRCGPCSPSRATSPPADSGLDGPTVGAADAGAPVSPSRQSVAVRITLRCSAQDVLPAGVVPHPLRVPDHGGVVDRQRIVVRELAAPPWATRSGGG